MTNLINSIGLLLADPAGAVADSTAFVAQHGNLKELASIADSSSVQEVVTKAIDWCVAAGWNIIAAALIYIVGRFLIKLIMKLTRAFMERRKVDASVRTFFSSLVNITLTILLAIAIIGRLGIETTSFAALLASAGVAVGMALSGNLQNFAGGLIILILRPYKVDDYIECTGGEGTVVAIQIFHTVLRTYDNRLIYIPNGSLSSGAIKNIFRMETRRIDWIVGVEYGEDFEHVKEVALDLVNSDSRILQDPAPFIALNELDSSSVNILIRVWVKTPDYWGVKYDMNRRIYDEFNKHGINFPFPQLTVHSTND